MDEDSGVGRSAARRHPAGLHALCMACAYAPGLVVVALSRRASRRPGPRCLHRPAVSLRGTGPLRRLACGSDHPHWRLPACVVSVADGSVALDPVSSLERAVSGGDRAAAQSLYRHAAHAWDASLDRAGGDKFELVERVDAVGPRARDAETQRAAGGDYHRGAGLSQTGGGHAAEAPRDAFRQRATNLAIAQRGAAGAPCGASGARSVGPVSCAFSSWYVTRSGSLSPRATSRREQGNV